MKWIAVDDAYHLAVIGLIQALRLVRAPGAAAAVAALAGRAAFYLSGTKRRRAEEGLRRWRGEPLGRRENRRFFSSVFGESWREILFAAEIDRAAGRRAHANLRIRGLDHLRAALAAGKGAILWESAGFGHRLYAKLALKSQGYEVLQVHGLHHLGGLLVTSHGASVLRDRVLGPFFDRRELCAVNRIVRVSDDSSLAYLRPVLESLRANAVVCITADGRAGHRFVSHDFLNHSIRFATGGVSLARLSGAALIPMFCYQGDGQGLILALESPVDLAPETSRDESADRASQHFVDLLTTYVERHPTQYRDWHLLATS